MMMCSYVGLLTKQNYLTFTFTNQNNFGPIVVIAVLAIATCHGFIQNTKSTNFLLEHRGLSVRGGQASMSLSAEVPELRAPKSMYSNAADIGATKAMQSPLKIFILGILSGCHIAFGKHEKYFKMSHFRVFFY